MANEDAPRNRRDGQRRGRAGARAEQQRKRATMRGRLIGGGVLVVALLGVSAYLLATRDSTTAASKPLRPGSPIDNISCQAEMLNYHIHAALALYKDGRRVTLPADTGIPINPAIDQNAQTYCLYSLHTHDTSGVVHIESPTPKIYTLGQFFDIWRYTAQWDAQSTLAASNGVSVDASFVDALRTAKPGAIHAYVNGKPVRSYRDITLTAHKLITVELGTPLKPPMTSYAFPSGE